MSIAYDAYRRWRDLPQYKGIFFPTNYIAVASNHKANNESGWIDNVTSQLTKKSLPWTRLETTSQARQAFPTLSGELAVPHFGGYYNQQAGWADASKAMIQLRDDCISAGVSFLCGRAGTVVGFDVNPQGVVKAAKAANGDVVSGDHFMLTAGSWVSGLVPMYNSTLSTGQVLGYVALSDAEVEQLKDLPIYANMKTGWFNFPPYKDTKTLKMAVHGWGYTREPNDQESTLIEGRTSSTPPLLPQSSRPHFAPKDGEERLRKGLREILPELADRPFEKLAVCWYCDTPTGDFVMDYHPDYKNLFVGGAGSGHAFKFLPVLGEYMSKAIHRRLPSNLTHKWRFRTDYKDNSNAFPGDGSRGGPIRRELSSVERAKLDGRHGPKL
ncbi:hypothetical protein ACHAPJ_000820 [Fusarium lateritium]